jgi:ArsR family transcriptional regulator
MIDRRVELFYNPFMEHLAQVLKALSDPIRLRIILLLHAEGELCVCDLMAVLGLPQSTVSRHLAYLKRSCWVDTRRQGVWMYYQLSRESCILCRELLEVLQRHATDLPAAAADRAALARFLCSKPHSPI